MKTILITGANKGIGFETAWQLAQLGHFVYIGSRDIEKGRRAVERLMAKGFDNVAAIELDVTKPESIQKAKMELESKAGALDVLINNAGISGPRQQNLMDIDMDDLRSVFDTNFFGVVQTTQRLLPLLRKSTAASIINVSSEIGSLQMNTVPGRPQNFHAYGSTKTALNAFTVMLANELKNYNICVNSVTPGFTATDLNQHQGTKTPEEGAKPIVALANLTDRSITGKFFKEGSEVPW